MLTVLMVFVVTKKKMMMVAVVKSCYRIIVGSSLDGIKVTLINVELGNYQDILPFSLSM